MRNGKLRLPSKILDRPFSVISKPVKITDPWPIAAIDSIVICWLDERQLQDSEIDEVLPVDPCETACKPNTARTTLEILYVIESKSELTLVWKPGRPIIDH